MHEMFNTKLLLDYKSATLQVAKIAKEILKEIFACEHFKFAGCFPQNFQSTSVLYSLKLLIAMILGGLSADINTQACLTIFYSTPKKKSTKNGSDSKNNQHTPSREPPLPLYHGLKLHSETWSKKLVDHLYNIGITWTTLCGMVRAVSRVIQVESNIALATCKQFQTDEGPFFFGTICDIRLARSLAFLFPNRELQLYLSSFMLKWPMEYEVFLKFLCLLQGMYQLSGPVCKSTWNDCPGLC